MGRDHQTQPRAAAAPARPWGAAPRSSAPGPPGMGRALPLHLELPEQGKEAGEAEV